MPRFGPGRIQWLLIVSSDVGPGRVAIAASRGLRVSDLCALAYPTLHWNPYADNPGHRHGLTRSLRFLLGRVVEVVQVARFSHRNSPQFSGVSCGGEVVVPGQVRHAD